MSLHVDVSSDGVRSPLGAERTAEIVIAVLRAERVRRARLSVTYLSNAKIARLNREHLDHDGPTDVISFPLEPAAGEVLGDIYVAPEVARESAARFGTGVREEIMRLLVHGTLHVLGYEHPEGEDEERRSSYMWQRQERLLGRIRAAERR